MALTGLFLSRLCRGQEASLATLPKTVTIAQGKSAIVPLSPDTCKNQLEIFNAVYQCMLDNHIVLGVHMAQKTGTHHLESISDAGVRSEVLKVIVTATQWPRTKQRPPRIRTADAVTRNLERADIGRALRNGPGQYPREHLVGPMFPPLSTLNETGSFGRIRVFTESWIDQHKGRDDGVPVGTEVRSIGNGVVMAAKEYSSEGKTVIVYHGGGAYSLYLHMSELQVKKGNYLRGTSVIGLSGDTGNSGGPHLHWGVYVNQKKVDPMQFIGAVNLHFMPITFR